MKKITTFICSCLAFLLINESVSFAYSSTNKVNADTKIQSESSIESYQITDENQISQIKSLDPGFKNESIQTRAFPSDNPDSRMITGKVRQTYKNGALRVVVMGLYNYIASKIPAPAKATAVYNFINAFVTLKIGNAVQPHYFEAWLWETHDWNKGIHIVYTTVVHYTDSSFSKMDGVEYYQVDYYPIYQNGSHYHKY